MFKSINKMKPVNPTTYVDGKEVYPWILEKEK